MDERQFIFESRIVGDIIPKGYIPGIRKELELTIISVMLSNYKVKTTLIDGKYHSVGLFTLAFEIAVKHYLK